MKTRKITDTRLELAFKALEVRKEIDEVLARHDAKLVLGWDGKWVKLQVHFPTITTDEALTVMETRKGGRARYMTEAEEIARAK